jgi:hypothetical protein
MLKIDYSLAPIHYSGNRDARDVVRSGKDTLVCCGFLRNSEL